MFNKISCNPVKIEIKNRVKYKLVRFYEVCGSMRHLYQVMVCVRTLPNQVVVKTFSEQISIFIYRVTHKG